jgi:Holliday junction resolvase RusA-like endonuclease
VITITLPPPNAKLHAHAKGGWQSKAGPTKKLRMLACTLAKQQAVDGLDLPIERATVQYRFFVPDRRRRDTGNMIQSQKPAIDGVKDAGVIVDDDWMHLRMLAPIVEIDRENPRVEICFFQESH